LVALRFALKLFRTAPYYFATLRIAPEFRDGIAMRLKAPRDAVAPVHRSM